MAKMIKNNHQLCEFSIEIHVYYNFESLTLVNQRFFNLVNQCIVDLLRINYSNVELLPKPQKGKYCVSAMSLIRKFGFFSRSVLALS